MKNYPDEKATSWLFQPDGKKKFTPAEIERFKQIRQERKKRNWTLNPHRY
jgi:hypothetical protein